MAIPSGLGASIGLADETTFNTYVAPSSGHFYYFKKENLELKKMVVASDALGAGRVRLGSRRVVPAVDVTGSIDFEVQERGMGLLLKHMLGSSATPAQISSTTAYKAVHTFNSNVGMSLTAQVGRPSIGGTISPFSYTGLKVTDWTLSAAAGQIAQISLNLDGAGAVTSQTYAAPSYVNSNVMHFAQGALTIGGTVTTATGVSSASGGTVISGGTYAGAVKSVNLKGTNALNVGRHTLGSITKKEQLPNGFVALTGDMEVEFVDLASLYTVFAATTPETSIALDFSLTGNQIGTSGNNAAIDFLAPQIFFDADQTFVQGPDILTQKLTFTVMSDAANNIFQATYTSADTTI